MDESRKQGDASPATDPWPKEEASPEDMGATGVFRAMSEPGAKAPQVPNAADRSSPFGDAPRPQPSGSVEGVREPIVHKVVVGAGLATASVDIRELISRNPPAAKTAVIPAGPATMPTQPLAGNANPNAAGMEAGFTALLRQQSADGESDRSQVTPGAPPVSRSSSPPGGSGGFTALLQGFSGVAEGPPRPAAQPSVPGQNSPGAFTQLLRTLAPAASAPTTTGPAITDPTGANAPTIDFGRIPQAQPLRGPSSFTELISAETIAPTREPSSPAPVRWDNSRSASRDPFATRSQESETPWRPNQSRLQTSDWSPPPAPAQPPATMAGEGEVTKLIRILDGSAQATEISGRPVDAAPVPSGAGESLFTQTYKKLDEPSPSPAPASTPFAPSPGPPAQPHPSATQPYVMDRGNSPQSGAPAAGAAAGPSEYTLNLDMSNLREMQRQRVPAPGQRLPPQSGTPTPSAPNPQSAQTPQYAPPAPMPQSPAPSPIAEPAAPPASSKMQQYLPLLLIVIIFLLVVILITMVFLLKH